MTHNYKVAKRLLAVSGVAMAKYCEEVVTTYVIATALGFRHEQHVDDFAWSVGSVIGKEYCLGIY
ncbi:hypothetical protein TUM3792_21440 [Shewanella sp. MBTL60-007]|nr:hypothetical protein TUM3792_21440 [Shewanella sp. MBTL60-007]